MTTHRIFRHFTQFSILGMLLVLSTTAWAVDPLALHLPFERISPHSQNFRATQINRTDDDSGYHFGLGGSWNPDIFAERASRLVADLGLALFTGSSQGSRQHAAAGLMAIHVSLLYEWRISETFGLEIGPGLVLCWGFGPKLSQANPDQRIFKGGRFTLRFQDRFEPALGGIFDRWTFGINRESMGNGQGSTSIEIGAGMRF